MCWSGSDGEKVAGDVEGGANLRSCGAAGRQRRADVGEEDEEGLTRNHVFFVMPHEADYFVGLWAAPAVWRIYPAHYGGYAVNPFAGKTGHLVAQTSHCHQSYGYRMTVREGCLPLPAQRQRLKGMAEGMAQIEVAAYGTVERVLLHNPLLELRAPFYQLKRERRLVAVHKPLRRKLRLHKSLMPLQHRRLEDFAVTVGQLGVWQRLPQLRHHDNGARLMKRSYFILQPPEVDSRFAPYRGVHSR